MHQYLRYNIQNFIYKLRAAFQHIRQLLAQWACVLQECTSYSECMSYSECISYSECMSYSDCMSCTVISACVVGERVYVLVSSARVWWVNIGMSYSLLQCCQWSHDGWTHVCLTVSYSEWVVGECVHVLQWTRGGWTLGCFKNFFFI